MGGLIGIGIFVGLVFVTIAFFFIVLDPGINALNPNSTKNKDKRGFWRRQFQIETTSKQKIFDWIFGVGLPVICFVFDPLVFKNNGLGNAILGNFKPFAYILSFISVMAMSAWLIWGEKLKWLNAFLAGAFAIGGIISLAVGIVLIPFSLLGLIILIGILGFTPLISAIVFLRNAVRAFHTANPFFDKQTLVYSTVLSAIFSLTLPAVVNLEIKKSLDNVRNGDAEVIHAEAKKLKYVAPLVNFDGLALLYFRSAPNEKQSEKMRAVAEFYNEMTGENIESKAKVLMD